MDVVDAVNLAGVLYLGICFSLGVYLAHRHVQSIHSGELSACKTFRTLQKDNKLLRNELIELEKIKTALEKLAENERQYSQFQAELKKTCAVHLQNHTYNESNVFPLKPRHANALSTIKYRKNRQLQGNLIRMPK